MPRHAYLNLQVLHESKSVQDYIQQKHTCEQVVGPRSVGVAAGVALRGPPAAPRGRAAPLRAPRGSPASAATAASGTTPSAASAPATARAPGLLCLGDDVVETHVDLVRHLKVE